MDCRRCVVMHTAERAAGDQVGGAGPIAASPLGPARNMSVPAGGAPSHRGCLAETAGRDPAHTPSQPAPALQQPCMQPSDATGCSPRIAARRSRSGAPGSPDRVLPRQPGGRIPGLWNPRRAIGRRPLRARKENPSRCNPLQGGSAKSGATPCGASNPPTRESSPLRGTPRYPQPAQRALSSPSVG